MIEDLTWVEVFDTDGCARVDEHDEPRIDAAVSELLSSGLTRDTLLDLTLLDGRSYRVRASAVNSWVLSTPEGRRRAVEISKQIKDEQAEHEAEFGIFRGDE